MSHFKKHIVFHDEGPVLVLFKRDGDKNSSKVEERLKRALIKTKGQFKLVLIDADSIDKQLETDFKIGFTPSVFLFYKSNIAQEYRGIPSKDQLKDFVRAAQFFYQMTNEEKLLTQILDEA